jgi:hypothetical protein
MTTVPGRKSYATNDDLGLLGNSICWAAVSTSSRSELVEGLAGVPRDYCGAASRRRDERRATDNSKTAPGSTGLNFPAIWPGSLSFI